MKEQIEEKMRNPNYKGEWKRPTKKNENYKIVSQPHKLDGLISAIGIDIFIVKAGVIFDNFIIADSEDDLKGIDYVENE